MAGFGHERNWQQSFFRQKCFCACGRQVLLGRPTKNSSPLYKFPTLGLLALGVSSVSLGIGYRALEGFKELAAKKIPTGNTLTLRDKYHAKVALAKATADIESAEAYIQTTVEKCFDAAERGRSCLHQSEIDSGLPQQMRPKIC